MNAIALVSAKGSPGVTTCAVLLAAVWPTAVLVEADPAGGDLRAWYTDPTGQPLRPDLGVVSLLTAHTAFPTAVHNPIGPVADARHDAAGSRRLLAHAQQLPGGLPVLIGPGSPAQAHTLRGQWPQLAAAITAHDGVVLIDAGRLTHLGSTGASGDSTAEATLAVLRACATTLLVCRANLVSIAHTRDLLTQLQHHELPAQPLLIGPAAARDDTARALGLYPELVHVLPEDPTAAAGLRGPWNSKLNRTALLTAARRTAGALHRQFHSDDHMTGHTAPDAEPDAATDTAPAPSVPAAIGLVSS